MGDIQVKNLWIELIKKARRQATQRFFQSAASSLESITPLSAITI